MECWNELAFAYWIFPPFLYKMLQLESSGEKKCDFSTDLATLMWASNVSFWLDLYLSKSIRGL